ncbi:hypothetical protein Agub_g11709, partial [Astrephomene gubernaculifera]
MEPLRAMDIRFGALTTLLDDIKGRKRAAKVKRLQRFFTALSKNNDGDDLYGLFRLLLPKLDHERGFYGIKEYRLASLLATALGASHPRARTARQHWRQLAHRGRCKFPDVMQQVLLDAYCPAHLPPGEEGLTVGEVNAALDRLAALAAAPAAGGQQQQQQQPETTIRTAAAASGTAGVPAAAAAAATGAAAGAGAGPPPHPPPHHPAQQPPPLPPAPPLHL